jgi:hypothetical protein
MRRLLPTPGLLSLALLVLALAVCLTADDKKKHAIVYVKAGQTADLDAPKLVMASQKCENWAVAAGLEAMLRSQNVTLEQAFWVMRWNRGEVCLPETPSMEALAEVVNREFVLNDGRHVQLELQFLPGPPTNLDATIAGIRQQRLTLLFLRGHAYYLTGVTYDEHIGANGSRMFISRELRLADTFPGNAVLTFVHGEDKGDDIAGTLALRVIWL